MGVFKRLSEDCLHFVETMGQADRLGNLQGEQDWTSAVLCWEVIGLGSHNMS